MKTREMRGLTVLGMAMLMAAAVSCKKSGDDAAAPSPAQGVFRASAEAQAGDSKTSINADRAVLWSDGDKIQVFDNSTGGSHTSYNFELLEGFDGNSHGEFSEPTGVSVPSEFYSGNYVAFYPTSAHYVSGYTMNLPQRQQYAAGSFGPGANPMAAASASTSLSFKNLCGALMLQFSNAQGGKVTKIRVVSRKANERLWGDGVGVTFGGDNTTLDMNKATSGDNTIELDCSAGGGVAFNGDTPFYIVLPDGTLQGGFDVEVTVSLGGKTYTYRKGVGGAVDNSIHRGLVRKMSTLQISVGFLADNNFVEFASGNLYCEPKEANKTETDVWGIEKHPWGSGVDCASSNQTQDWDPKHVSHFYWTYDAAKAAGQEAFTKGSKFFTDSIAENYVFKALDTDGKETQWRTLSDKEWRDILSTARVTNYGHPWARVYMRPTPEQPGVKAAGDVRGLLLFPAEWGLPAKGESHGDFAELSAAAFQSGSSWTSENFVREEWLEEGGLYGGCVFLPCAGWRDGSSSGDGTAVKAVGTGGNYWSSTISGSIACGMYFYSGNVKTDSDYGYNARCVRPVRRSEN